MDTLYLWVGISPTTSYDDINIAENLCVEIIVQLMIMDRLYAFHNFSSVIASSENTALLVLPNKIIILDSECRSTVFHCT